MTAPTTDVISANPTHLPVIMTGHGRLNLMVHPEKQVGLLAQVAASNVGVGKVGSDRPALMMLTFSAPARVVVRLKVDRTRHLVRAGE